MRKKMKWGLAAFALLLMGLLVYVVAGPYLAINGIRHLVANQQYDQLWRFVDFAQLRESIGPQIQERVVQGMLGRVGHTETDKAVGDVTALITKPAIDAIVSPLGVATLLTGTALAKRAAGQQDADGKTRPIDPLKDAETRFESPSRFTATVQSLEGKPVVFEFSRSGLRWKLTGIRLPDL